LWEALVGLIRDILALFFTWTGNYGLAIILLTVGVRVLLLPLTFSQTRSLQKMQELQPELQRLQKKYRNDPQRLNEETMKLWRQHGVSPLGGCLPLLVQMPILLALYQALVTFPFQGPSRFLWIESLATPDPYYVLPVLSGVATYGQSATATIKPAADPTQRMMTYVFPFVVVWISLNLPAGLVLYWLVSSAFSIVQQLVQLRGEAVVARRKAERNGKGGA
jgi:YidC/Oxa1 family membrane protein insertase